MYDAKAKASMMKYKKEKREEVRLNVPKGTLAKYKAYAASKGMSMTALMTQLMEREMENDGFNKKWSAIEEAEQAEQDATKQAEIDRLKSENAAAMREGMNILR